MAHHLVIQLARFGDVIQTKRLILSLAGEVDSVVHLAVDVSLVSIARLVYPFAAVHGVRAHGSNTSAADVFRENRDVFAALSSIPFTSVYNLNYSGMAMAMAGLFDPNTVHGYIRRNGQELRGNWLRMAFRWMRERTAAPMNLVDLWAHFHPSPLAPALVNPRATEKNNGRIVVVPAGRESRRSLPPEILAPLVEVVFASCGGPEIVLVGSAAEQPSARKLTKFLRPMVAQKVANTCGRTSLADLAEIVSASDVVLTPDTGVMHLAAHFGVRVRAFFLSSAWSCETGPYGEGHTVFQATHSCAPCVETSPCASGTACLAPFSNPAVARALLGKEPEQWPEGLASLTSGMDAFGCVYAVLYGTMPETQAREAARALLAEYAGTPLGLPVAARTVETVFHESDWMLPQGEALRPHTRKG